MNLEVKSKWVQALRSGEYKQGTHVLKHDNAYCCLGVLCDLYSKEHDASGFNGENVYEGGTRFMDEEGDYSSYMPTPSVSKWAGLDKGWVVPRTAVSPHLIKRLPAWYTDGSLGLQLLNDSLGATFDEIADLIEKWL